MKAGLVAGDFDGVREDARWALDAGAEGAESPIGRYAAALAWLLLGDDAAAGMLAATLGGRDDFPAAVADSLVALAARDHDAYESAIRALLEDFEQRAEFLEDIRVADTVLALQRLASCRALDVELASPMLPATPRTLS